MTREEAIAELQAEKELYKTDICHADDGSPDGRLIKALDMAMSALTDVEKLKEQLANCHKEILRLIDLRMTGDDDSNDITESVNDVVEKNDEVIEPSDLMSHEEAWNTIESDLISRANALAYPLSFDHYDKENGSREFICGVESYREYIQHLPSVSVESKATENKYDCDLISRADAIEAICETIMSEFDYPPTAGYEIAEKSLKTLPSVSANSDDLIIKNGKGIQDGLYNIKDGEIFKYKAKGGTVRAYKLVPSVSAERSGEWEYEIMVMPLSNHTKDSYRCSVCHTHWDCETNYCPNCGARMENTK